MRWGHGKYFMGSQPFYVAAVSLYRMAERPFLVSGLGIFWGYAKSLKDKAPRMEDPDYLRFLRRFERESLLFGKRRATERFDQRVRERPPPKHKAAR
jgi:hypothetical protein